MERYDRQILLPEIGEAGQEKLRSARVLLVGVGGLGSPVALYLAGAGIGRLGLVDDDVVSLSNLQRQILYTEEEVGQKKVLCAARRLQALNSEIRIDTYPTRLTAENAADLISRYDVVVDGCDNFATRYTVSDVCSRLHIPYIYAAIGEWEGQVAILCHGADGKTYRDLYPDETAMLSMPHPGRAVIGVTPAIVGSVEAGEVVKLLCECDTPLVNRLWTIDVRTLQSHVIAL